MRPVSPLPFLLPPFPSQRRAEFLIYINTRTLMAVNCGKFTSPRERERISLNASTLPQLLFGRILMSYRYIFEMFYNHVCLKDNASLDDKNIIELNSFPFLLSLPLLLFLINLQLVRLTRSNVSRVSNRRTDRVPSISSNSVPDLAAIKAINPQQRNGTESRVSVITVAFNDTFFGDL